MSATPSQDWNEETNAGGYGYNEAYLKIWLVFEFLSLTALLGFLVWSFFIRQPRADSSKPLPMKALVGSILAFIGARVTNIIVLFVNILNKTVKNSFVVVNILNLIFYLTAFMLGFFVFWYLIHKLLERVTERSPSNIYRIVAIAHWVLLAIMSAIVVAVCAVYIAYIANSFSKPDELLILLSNFYQLSFALDIICWIASIEILGCMIFIFIKAGSDKRTGVPAIAVGAFFFFVINLILVIIQIVYYVQLYSPPAYLSAAQSIMEFICVVGTYVGVMLGFQKWSRSGFISEPRNTMEDYERQMMANDSRVSSIASSQHATVHPRQKEQQQMRYAVPEGAAASQQVHMWT